LLPLVVICPSPGPLPAERDEGQYRDR